MPTRLPAPIRRQQLLDVALGEFGASGYHQTSMVDIATRAGVTKPVLYQHFESKRHLFIEVLRDAGQRLQATIDAATAGVDGGRSQVEQGFRAFVDFFVSEPAGFRVRFSDSSRVDETFAIEIARVEEGLARQIAALIHIDGTDDLDRQLLAHGIVGMAEATVRYWMSSAPELGAERVSALLSELAWAGLRGRRRAG